VPAIRAEFGVSMVSIQWINTRGAADRVQQVLAGKILGPHQ